MAIFRLFGSVFAIHPLFILKESVDQTKRHRNFEFGTWEFCMIINRALKSFLIFLKQLQVSWQNPKLLQRKAFWLQLFPFECDLYHERLFGK